MAGLGVDLGEVPLLICSAFGQGYSTATNGRIVIAVLSALAEQHLDNVKTNWQEATSRAVDSGIHIAARPPLGYLRADKINPEYDSRGRLIRNGRLVVDPATAPAASRQCHRRSTVDGWRPTEPGLDTAGSPRARRHPSPGAPSPRAEGGAMFERLTRRNSGRGLRPWLLGAAAAALLVAAAPAQAAPFAYVTNRATASAPAAASPSTTWARAGRSLPRARPRWPRATPRSGWR